MLHPNQGRALQDPKYALAVQRLPVAHHADEPVGNMLPRVQHAQLHQQALLASAVRTQKEAAGSYFRAALMDPNATAGSSGNNNGAGVGRDLSGSQRNVLDSKMTFQAHHLQRERQMAQYVQQLEEEDKQLRNQQRANRIAQLQEAHAVDRVKLHQSARQRLELQQRSHQQVPAALLDKFGLHGVHEEIAASNTACAEERRALRDLPRLAHVEYNLPRILDAALNRQERLHAHRERITQRVALEEKVRTGYARKRMREHARINRAREIAGLARSDSAGNDGLFFGSSSSSQNQQRSIPAPLEGSGVHLVSLNKNTLADNPLSLYAARRPGREELRDARELERKHERDVRATEQEKVQLLAEMAAIDKQTASAEKAARAARGKRKSANSDSD